MIRGLALFFCVLIVAALGVPTAHAAGHGPALKGQEIDQSVSLTGQTGACACLEQWYTLGLKPGQAAVSGQLKACGDRGQPYCFMVVSLLRGDRTLQTVSAQCSSKATHCNRAWSIKYRVKVRGVYYVQVRGEVGLTMNFTLHPSGHIYPLHCGKYC